MGAAASLAQDADPLCVVGDRGLMDRRLYAAFKLRLSGP